MSYVIPAYNEEVLLPACIHAIQAQTPVAGVEREIIVVDNASTDTTAAVALALGVRVVTETTKGLSAARQAGFRAATGDLIANIDADIQVPAHWEHTVVAHFSDHPHLVGLSGPHIFYELNIITRVSAWIFYAVGIALSRIGTTLFHRGAFLQGGNMVMRTEALKKIGGFDTAFTFYGEDIDIALRLSRIGHVAFSFALGANASARRMKKDGVVKTGVRYAANYFWTSLFRKPFTPAHEDIRE